MVNTKFKKLFGAIAKSCGFEFVFSGWIKESNDCIIALDLMKSNFGNYYELNIKTFIQGAFGKNYLKSKDLVKREVANILRRPPAEYADVLDLDSVISDSERNQKLELMFKNFLIPLTDKLLTRAGISELVKENKLDLLPPIKQQLGL